jgi:SagB-type dehydrogenase family enzyme
MKKVLKFHDELSLLTIPKEPKRLPKALTETYYKRYPRFPRVPLYRIGGDGLARLPTIRHFPSAATLPLKKLSRLFGVLSQREGESPSRLHPSAGARYPIEAYLISWSVGTLQKGVYHYDVREHYLEQMGVSIQEVDSKMINSPHVKHAHASIVLTACLNRTVLKYGARGYLYALLEAGHIAQNVVITAGQIGIGTCCVGGFVAQHVQATLDLPPTEIPVYVIAVGPTRH